jgi:hypothetical protein
MPRQKGFRAGNPHARILALWSLLEWSRPHWGWALSRAKTQASGRSWDQLGHTEEIQSSHRYGLML